MESRIISHHVGGRNGNIAFPIHPPYARDVLNVIFDADIEAIGQIRDHWSAMLCETIVLPHCLGGRNGSAVFNINTDPNTSSLYPFNEDYAEWSAFQTHTNADHVLGDVCRTARKVHVEVVTLDHLIAQGVPSPDFLSLDTQGSEFDILTGAEHALPHILGIQTEVEFAPMYKGQKLFRDIDGFLTERGFMLAELTMGHMAPGRAPIGARAKAPPLWGDALYLRTPTSIIAQVAAKYAFICAAFGQLELALNVEPTRTENSYSELAVRLHELATTDPTKIPDLMRSYGFDGIADEAESKRARMAPHADHAMPRRYVYNSPKA